MTTNWRLESAPSSSDARRACPFLIATVSLSLLCQIATAQTPNFKLPFTAGESWIVTCGYGCGAHTGRDAFSLDFGLNGCNAFDKPILATADGTVSFVGGPTSNTCGTLSYGQRVEIDHGNGFVSTYAHLESVNVAVGQQVCQGELIGTCGNTGNACGSACAAHPGTHLHFHVRHNNNAYKPEPISGFTNIQAFGSYLSDNMITCSPIDAALLVSHGIPSQITVGESINVTVTFRNTGNTTWTSDVYRLAALDSSDPFAASTHAITNGQSVAPGAEWTFNFAFVAPISTGEYISDWRMSRDGVGMFGDSLVQTVTVSTDGPVIIIESRTGGQNHAWYSESGTWADAGASSSAPGTTPGIGSRYGATLTSIAGVKVATFTPQIASPGEYRVFTTWPSGASRQTPILHRVTHANGIATIEVDQTAPASQWLDLGTYTFSNGNAGSVSISNELLDVSGAMYASAVKFEKLVAVPIPGDFDHDGDVDLTDFGHLQTCYSGPGVAQNAPACFNARFDLDADVDQDDFGLFQSCLSGANVAADPACLSGP